MSTGRKVIQIIEGIHYVVNFTIQIGGRVVKTITPIKKDKDKVQDTLDNAKMKGLL